MSETRREMAVRHVLSGRKIVAAQRERVHRLRLEGKDTSEAENLLTQYKRTLAIFEDDLEKLQVTGEPQPQNRRNYSG